MSTETQATEETSRPQPRKPRLTTILAEYGIKIVPTNKRAHGERQTHAGRILAKILRDHGADHLRALLTSIVDTEGNERALITPVICATSRLLIAHAHWWQQDASRWLEVFDDTNLIRLHAFVKANRGAVSVPDALAQELYGRLVTRFGDPSEPKPNRERRPSIERDFALSVQMVAALQSAMETPDGPMLPKRTHFATHKALRRRELITRDGRLTDQGRDVFEGLVSQVSVECNGPDRPTDQTQVTNNVGEIAPMSGVFCGRCTRFSQD